MKWFKLRLRAARLARARRDLADREHVAWARKLGDESRARRAGPDGLLAVTDCRLLGDIEAHGTDGIVADVIGPLTYEEQSEMIGDPAADVLFTETGGEPWTERER